MNSKYNLFISIYFVFFCISHLMAKNLLVPSILKETEIFSLKFESIHVFLLTFYSYLQEVK